MAGYTKLFSDIVESSIWDEDADTCKVWITLLALSDSEGFVRGSPGWLSKRARVSLEKCLLALTKFKSPDPVSRTSENEGRRIEDTPDGWVIVNYAMYRRMDGRELSKDSRRTYQREWMRKKRSQQVSTPVNVSKPSASASASASESGKGEGVEGEKTSPRDDAFLKFWVAYPKKVGKGDAKKVFYRKDCHEIIERLVTAIDAQKKGQAWQKDGGQFIPNPSTWLNQDRWEDEVFMLNGNGNGNGMPTRPLNSNY